MKPAMPILLRADARQLPLPDASVDLVVTSPPYFGLRDYGHDGQIGVEPTPAEFLDALIAVTAECARVLKPTGSIFVNLGDKYSGAQAQKYSGSPYAGDSAKVWAQTNPKNTGIPRKSLMLLPERYRIRCVDELGLTARAVLIWSKSNALPESVTDRVRRSHEDWVHLTINPNYFSAIDEIRNPYDGDRALSRRVKHPGKGKHAQRAPWQEPHQLGSIPGSVWTISSQPLTVPAELGVDHYAAFPMEWPRRLIAGWCPREVCSSCGDGRRPVTEQDRNTYHGAGSYRSGQQQRDDGAAVTGWAMDQKWSTATRITGYACSCPDTSAPATSGVVLDPFGGTGTTALVAAMLGRTGISVDLSPDYQRIARWRCTDPRERARAAGLEPDQIAQIARPDTSQLDLFGEAAS